MKWIELREWLGLAPADIPCWASFALLLLTFTSGGGALAAFLAAGSIILAAVDWAIGFRRNPQLGEGYHRIKRWAYPAFLVITMAGVGYYYTRSQAAIDDPVDPQAVPALVTSSLHKFSISFPFPYQKPEEDTSTHGLNSMTTWIATGRNGALAVSVVVYPEQMFKANTPQGLLAEVHYAAVRNLEGTVEKQEEVLFEGHPALRSVVDHHERKGQKGYSRFELIVVPPRLYTIRTSHASRAALDSTSLKSFEDSFRLNP